MNTDSYFLIIRERDLDDAELERHVGMLSKAYGLDAYQLRLCLRGFGLAIVAKGEESTLKTIGSTLGELGYSWFVTPSRRPRLDKPHRIKRFEMTKDSLILEGDFGRIGFGKGERALGVLASLNGRTLSKLIRRSAVQRDKNATLTPAEKYDAIVQSPAIFDFYPLPARLEDIPNEPIPAFRLEPGRFDVESLGEHATSSSTQNFDRAVRIFRKYAGKLHMEMDFGLFQLPGCRMDLGDSEIERRHTLDAITTYGWYVQMLYRGLATHPPKRQAAPAAVLAAGTEAGNNEALDPHAEEEAETKAAKLGLKPPLPPVPFKEKRSVLPVALWKTITFGSVMVVLYFLALFAKAGTGLGPLPEIGRTLYLWGITYGFLHAFASGVCFYYAFKFFRHKRWIENTPTSRVRSMAMGLVELIGTARRAHYLTSPVSGLPVIYYRVLKYQSSEAGWHFTGAHHSGNVPFYLKDETGEVLVDPNGADISPTHKETYYDVEKLMGFADMSGSPRRASVAQNHNMRFGNGMVGTSSGINTGPGPGHSKTVEEIIPEGAQVYVLGDAVTLREEPKSFSRRIGEKLRLLKQDKHRLRMYDTNGDGEIDDVEWQAARKDAEADALNESLTEKEPQAMVVVRKPEAKGLPFLILNSKSERSIVTRHGIYATLLFLGGLVFTALAVNRWVQ